MKHIQILLVSAALGLAGCSAQEGKGATVPGNPPQAFDDIVAVQTNSANNTISPLANDVDLSGTGLSITGVTVDQVLPPTAGSVVSTNGTDVTFTPPPNFIGVVTLDYAIKDATGATSSALIAISVLPIALPPVALPDVATVVQDSGANDIDVLANDADFAGGGLTLTGVSIATSLPPSAAHTVSVSGNQVRFTPAAGFVGAVVVNYTADDVNGETANGVLTVVVTPLNLAVGPVPVPDAVIVAQDSGASLIDVLANDVDPAAGGLTLTGLVVTASLPNAVHTATLSANQVQFTPAAGFAGTVVITYTATDVDGNAADGVLSIVVSPLDLTVGPVPLPDAVIVAQDSAATDIDVLANDVDFAAGGLTLTGLSITASAPAAAHTATMVGNKVRFTPAPGVAGVVVLSYTATDVNGDSANGVLNIVVSPTNPVVGLVAIPDTAVLPQDSAATDIDVLANDVDFAGGGLALTNAVVTSSLPAAAHTVAVVGNKVRFTPAAGFAGVVVVTYTAQDVNAQVSNGVLDITVTPTGLVLGPVAAPDVGIATSTGGAQLFDVLANDVDPAAGGLTLTLVSVAQAVPAVGVGTVAIAGNQVQYTPTSLAYLGAVLVSYTATDINGNTTTGQLSLTVTP